MSKQNFKVESGWDLLLGLSLVVIVGAGYYAFSAPKPASGRAAEAEKSLRSTERSNRTTTALAKQTQETVKRLTWDVAPETLGAQMMGKLTAIADRHHVQLSSFFVGKPIKAPSLIQTPFVVTIQGTYQDVLHTVQAIENPDSKIAVNGLKLEPAKTLGTEANMVSTTLNLTAFLYKEEA